MTRAPAVKTYLESFRFLRTAHNGSAAVERHAANARELVSTRFSSEAMARRYLDLYTSVLHERTSAA